MNGENRYSGIFNIEWTPKHVIMLIVIFVILVISMLTLVQGFKTVPSGYKGVLVEWGKVVGMTDEGLHYVNPISQDIVLMNVQTQKTEATESTASSDLQEVTTTIAVNYRLRTEYADESGELFDTTMILESSNQTLKKASKPPQPTIKPRR